MKEHNTHPIAPVLAEADNLATIATRLLEAADELEKAQQAANKDSTTTNMDMLEHAKALHRDRAAEMRFNIDEYSKRIDCYRGADGRDTRLIAAANAALHYIAAIHGAEVPMAPFDADLTASALAGALNPYKTPYGREVDIKMAVAVSTAKQARRFGRECGCGWRGHLEDCLWLGAVGPLCPACRETTEEAEQGQTAPANQQRAGVYHKFNVSRTDGRDLPSGDRHGAEYFVLDVTHDEFAMPALAAYAAACRSDYPALADDMMRRYGIAQQQAEPVAWVRFCSDGCYEGPLMNSSPAMDGARRTSGAWTPLFAAQLVARDVLMALAEEVRETCWQVGSGDATIRELDLAAIVDRYAAQPPAVATRIRELEAQLNAAILARREAQQVAQEAIEARNATGVEIRRPLLKRIAELEAQQAAVPNDVTKDAARYRWLRQDESEFSSMAPAELDAAIDKAIAAAQKGGAA